MNKKYYLLTMVLFGSMTTTFSQVYAKSANTHGVNRSDASQKQSQQGATTPDNVSDPSDAPAILPQIGQIHFSGNTQISSDALRKVISLKVKDVANENTIMDSMVKIAKLYKTKNIKVTITPILQKTSPLVTNIVFDIHEIAAVKE